MKIVALFLLSVAFCLADQTAPGTSSRPILSSSEANYFKVSTYLQGWTPDSISTSSADYTVGSGYSTIQAAVNAAVNAGGSTRKYINIPSGTYSEVIYIPSSSPPLTIYGAGVSNTKISLAVSATLTGSQYQSLVGKFFSSGDPAYSMYESCASKSAIGTGCANVFWSKAAKLQIVNLSIENSSKLSGTDQAVALHLDGDEIQVHDVNLLGHQDTVYTGSGGTTVQRQYFTNTYIEGDIDFIFGGATAIFSKCTFHVKADRKTDEATVFAPDTDPHKEYGYLVIDSTITGDSAWSSSKTVYLARAWDSGVSSASDYVAGTSPNGQLVIRETSIDGIVTVSAPYTSATSGRAFSGNAASSRDLNNQNYNRFWEYANTGSGA